MYCPKFVKICTSREPRVWSRENLTTRLPVSHEKSLITSRILHLMGLSHHKESSISSHEKERPAPFTGAISEDHRSALRTAMEVGKPLCQRDYGIDLRKHKKR